MKRGSLLSAAAVVLVANAFTLAHAWRNRSGPADSDITLTERELTEDYKANDEDSGVSLHLRWTDQWRSLYMLHSPLPWLDQKILKEVGFDIRVAPSDKAASDFYARQRARRAFVALEYDGPSWRKWIDDVEHQAQQPFAVIPGMKPTNPREVSTRLVAIDASSDAARLRGRHPDKGSVIIVPAVIRIGVEPKGAKPAAHPQLYGSIEQIPSSIHVPLPFSDVFRRLPAGDRNTAKYRVHLRYGSLLEPWIVAVELPAPRLQ
jgi:Domain of unknown function (DUF4824)